MRTWLLALAILVLAVAVGGTVLWNVAVARAGSTFDEFVAREALLGHTWSCPQRQFSGYPFKIALDCVEPTYVGDVRGRSITASAKGLHAQFAVYQPDRVTLELQGPVEIAVNDGQKATLNWASAQLTASGLPFGIDRVAVDLQNPTASVTMPESWPMSFAAANTTLQVRKLSASSAQDPDLEVAVNASRAMLPPLDRIMGSTDPADLDLLVSVRQAGLLARGDGAQRLETWRIAGGEIDIGRAAIVKGNANIAASGKLSIDDAHRPSGDVNLSLAGVDGVLHRFGLPTQASSLGGLLGGLFSGKKARGQRVDAAADPRAMRLGLSLAQGRVSLGPLPLPLVLPALY